MSDLLGTTQVTSSDFNTVKALVQGSVDSFMGFKFISSNRLPHNGTSRQVFAYAQDGLKCAIGKSQQQKLMKEQISPTQLRSITVKLLVRQEWKKRK
jgi:hypothetical protein